MSIAGTILSIVGALVYGYLTTGQLVSDQATKELNKQQSSIAIKAANALIKDDALMAKLTGKSETQISQALANSANSDPYIANILNEATQRFQAQSEDLRKKINDSNVKISELQNRANMTNTQTNAFKYGQGKEARDARDEFNSIEQNINSEVEARDRAVKEYQEHVEKGINPSAYSLGVDQIIKGGTK